MLGIKPSSEFVYPDVKTRENGAAPHQVPLFEGCILDRIGIILRTVWYEVTHCLASKGTTSTPQEGVFESYKSHIEQLQSGAQLGGAVIADWLDRAITVPNEPITIWNRYCDGETIWQSLRRKFTPSCKPEKIELPDLKKEHNYVVIPVVLGTLPFNHIVLFLYEKETNTLEFYDSKGYSLLDHEGDVIAKTNISLHEFFRAAYRKYCIPSSQAGNKPHFKENITQHQFDKDACGVFVMDRIEQRAIYQKSWEETQQEFGLTQDKVLGKRKEFADVFSHAVIKVPENGADTQFLEEDEEEIDNMLI